MVHESDQLCRIVRAELQVRHGEPADTAPAAPWRSDRPPRSSCPAPSASASATPRYGLPVTIIRSGPSPSPPPIVWQLAQRVPVKLLARIARRHRDSIGVALLRPRLGHQHALGVEVASQQVRQHLRIFIGRTLDPLPCRLVAEDDRRRVRRRRVARRLETELLLDQRHVLDACRSGTSSPCRSRTSS